MMDSSSFHNNMTSIKIATWNLKSFKNNSSFITNKLNHDIILLQETWLHDFEETLVQNLNPDYLGLSVSSMPSGLLSTSGRPRPSRGLNKKILI